MTPESSSRNVCRRETSDPSESLPFPVGGVSLLRRQQIPLAVLAGHWYFGGNQSTCCHVPVMPWPASVCLSVSGLGLWEDGSHQGLEHHGGKEESAGLNTRRTEFQHPLWPFPILG